MPSKGNLGKNLLCRLASPSGLTVRLLVLNWAYLTNHLKGVMIKPFDTIQRALEDKFSVERVSDQKLQWRPSASVLVEVTHWFHPLQIVRNNQQVATFIRWPNALSTF